MLKPSLFPSLETRSTRLKLRAEKTTFFHPGTDGGFNSTVGNYTQGADPPPPI